MRPSSSDIYNFCQHAYKHFEYMYGITGIVGSNGAGKSNFIDEAQFFAITGKTSLSTATRSVSGSFSSSRNAGLVTIRLLVAEMNASRISDSVPLEFRRTCSVPSETF